MKNKAFTIAEVMITLSIIGVIAAIMIPVLDDSRPDEITLNYRKAFYAIEEGVQSIVNDTKLYEDGDLLHPKNETSASGDTTGRILCYNLSNALNTIGAVTCPGDSGSSTLKLVNSNGATGSNMLASQQNFKFSNGAAIGGIHGEWSSINDDLSTVSASNEYFITLCVDVNGLQKGPNKGCKTSDRSVDKRDQFRIRVSRDGKVYTGNSVGANNWFMENMMLVNPRVIVSQKEKWTETQKQNLIRSASSTSKPSLTSKTPSLEEYGYIWVNSLSRWTFTGGFIPSEKKKN